MSIIASRRSQRQKRELDEAAERKRETETTLTHLNILIKGLTEQTNSLEEVRLRFEKNVGERDA